MGRWFGRNPDSEPRGARSRKDSRSERAEPVDPRRVERVSHGVEYFFRHLNYASGLRLLDLGSLVDRSMEIPAELGFQLTVTSFDTSYNEARPSLIGDDGLVSPRAADRFVRMHLDFPPKSFHGILAWGVLQQLDRPAMRVASAHLLKLMRSQAALFCMFQDPDEDGNIAIHSCEVASMRTVRLHERVRRPLRNPVGAGSAREIEMEFAQFRAVHYFLKHDSILEVLLLN